MYGEIKSVSLSRRLVRYQDGRTERIDYMLDQYGFEARGVGEVETIILEDGSEFSLTELEECLV